MKLSEMKNYYTGDIVFCKDLNDVVENDGIVFVRVFKQENPERTFLVNREAFKILSQ
jgi:hypothetical protein